MILSQHVESKPGYKMALKGGKSLTIPGLAMDLKFAMQQYKRAQPIEKMIAYYEKEGLEMPDFGMMNTIEKYEALNDFRKQKKQAEEELSNIQNRRQNEILAEKQAKAKASRDSSVSDTGESKSK